MNEVSPLCDKANTRKPSHEDDVDNDDQDDCPFGEDRPARLPVVETKEIATQTEEAFIPKALSNHPPSNENIRKEQQSEKKKKEQISPKGSGKKYWDLR